jgi:hypothetical protein
VPIAALTPSYCAGARPLSHLRMLALIRLLRLFSALSHSLVIEHSQSSTFSGMDSSGQDAYRVPLNRPTSVPAAGHGGKVASFVQSTVTRVAVTTP